MGRSAGHGERRAALPRSIPPVPSDMQRYRLTTCLFSTKRLYAFEHRGGGGQAANSGQPVSIAVSATHHFRCAARRAGRAGGTWRRRVNSKITFIP